MKRGCSCSQNPLFPVIPAGNLRWRCQSLFVAVAFLLPSPLLLSSPQGICFCRCPFAVIRRESASLPPAATPEGRPATAKISLRPHEENTKKAITHYRAKSPGTTAPETRPTPHQIVHRPGRFLLCSRVSRTGKALRQNESQLFAERRE